MEEFVDKIQQEMSVFDRDYLRKIQSTMFRCSAECCDNIDSSPNEMQRCLDRCSTPALKADKYMQEQMQDMQDRFQRCAISCADKIKDRGDSSTQKNRVAMEECVVKCGDEIIKVLPTYTKRMREFFNKGVYLQ